MIRLEPARGHDVAGFAPNLVEGWRETNKLTIQVRPS